MKRSTLSIFVSLLVFVSVISLVGCSHMGQEEGQMGAGEGQMETVEGTVICLLPDYQKGTVKPVIASGPCVGLPEHSHVMLGKDGKIYFIQGLDKGLQEIGTMTKRRDVMITGRVMESPAGWVLFVR